ncbi:MAG: hypothetical protein JWM15_511, partial [Cryptosporangiaceae bacterium]|nr:hypothetical protein [Cryptosporangiaceae bacterium]
TAPATGYAVRAVGGVLGVRGRLADGWEVRAAAIAAARAWRGGLAPVVVGPD